MGCPEGNIPWLWVSNRGEQHSCWHTILLAKSSVLYLLRPLAQEMGCHRTGQTFSCGSRRTNICKHGRLADIRSSGVGDAAKCRPLTETVLHRRGSKRYIKPAAATHFPKRSSLIHPSFRRLFSNMHPHASMIDASRNVRCCSYHHGSSSHTLSRACASVFFALLTERLKCFAVSASGCSVSSSKPKR